jgi:hypothetical protein
MGLLRHIAFEAYRLATLIRDVARHGFRAFFSEIRDHHGCTILGKGQRNGTPNPCCRPSDNRDVSL